MVKIFNVDITNLNDLEIEIYKYILNNKEKVVYMTIRELAEEIHISTTTILRFCKKNGYTGFSEFKSNLKLGLNKEKLTTSFSEINSFDEFSRELERVNKEIDKVVEILKDKETVLFIGTGSSGALAAYGSKYMAHFNKFSIYIDDPYYPLNAKVLKNSIAIVISVSGENISVLEMVEKLKELDVKTISITNKKTSTLAKLTDYTINYYISEERYYYNNSNFLEYSDITSQLPTIYIIEKLAKKSEYYNCNRV